MALRIGDSLGRYRLEELIGQGGMAVVYRAVDAVLGRTVAVKVIRPAYTEDPQFVDRFLQEARVVASLDHPNILPLYDFGEADGAPYLVLPYLPGGSLADRLQGRPTPLALAAAWVLQLAGALDAAHARGVLHRDVKPGNVLVGKDGRLVLGDFGIARLAESTTRLTATGMVVGTPVYMAPELARGGDASPASDRYALAVMIYEMLSGRPPFLGSNPLSILHQQVHEPVPPLQPQVPELPAAVDALLARALAKDPAARHPTARAMAEELLQTLSPEQRAELSTLVWTGAADLGTRPSAIAASEAPTALVDSEPTRRLPATDPTRLRPQDAPTRVLARRGPPAWVWAALGGGVVAAIALLLLSPDWVRHATIAPAKEPAATSTPAPAPTVVAAAPSSASGIAGGSANPTGASTPVPASAAALTTGARAPAPPLQDAQSSGAGAPAAVPPTASAAAQPSTEGGALGGGSDAAASAAGARGVLQLMRRPAHAMRAEDFDRLLAATAGVAEQEETSRPGNRELRSGVASFRDWARGGLAYAHGDVAAASDLRASLAGASAPWSVAWAAAVFRDAGEWSLAALYADPRGNLDELLRPALDGRGKDARATLGAAYLAHLRGQHAAAVEMLLAAGVDPRRDTRNKGLVLAAQFLAAEAAETGDAKGVDTWLPFALESGRAPFVRSFLAEMTLIARDHLGVSGPESIRARACELGVTQACGGAERSLDQPAGRSRLGERFRRRGGPGGFRRRGGPGAD